MKYKLTVIEYGENNDYEAEMAKWKEEQGMYNRRFDEPSYGPPKLEKAERSLEVFLTEGEYKKVKAEVIKVFE